MEILGIGVLLPPMVCREILVFVARSPANKKSLKNADKPLCRESALFDGEAEAKRACVCRRFESSDRDGDDAECLADSQKSGGSERGMALRLSPPPSPPPSGSSNQWPE
ncbi:hypothetical protein MRX96_051886 [Rhipicephalus microplus]